MDMSKQELRCRKILFIINYSIDLICPKCNNQVFYVGSKYELICKKCAFKREVTRNTFFHNTRIGLSKYFEICYRYKNNDYKIHYKDLTKNYKLSTKTAYRIKNTLKNNIAFIDKISAKYVLKNSVLNNQIKRTKKTIKLKNYYESLDL